MLREKYKKRIIDQKLEEYLKSFGAVCIEGPKWCGKTWTGAFHSNSEICLADPAGNFQNRTLANLNPALVLEGDKPRLLDEWQEVPPLWDAVRFSVDRNIERGQYILTGSSAPNHKGILHSGAGRIARLRMCPMSLFEAGKSTGKISLKDLCNGKFESRLIGNVELTDLMDFVIRGGWPANQEIPIEHAANISAEYIKAVVEDDIFRMDGIKSDTHKMELLLRSLARNESTTVTNKHLKDDIKEIDDQDIVVEIDNQKPFGLRLRSSVRVKQAEKRHFADPSLACSLLNASTEMLLNDLNIFGFLFEALCERDLKIYAESFGANLYHYQDYSNRKIDAVVSLPSGEWCGFEIKLGANQIDAAAESLLKIKREIEKDEDGRPSKILCVLCGLSNAAYQRQDGVYVVPLTALGP